MTATHSTQLALYVVRTAAVHLAIRDQAARPFDPGRYDAEVDRLYRAYPDSARLAAACTVRCESGREVQ